MRINSATALVTIAALVSPGIAHAQNISPLIAGLALSPILVFLLAIVLGIVSRSWRVGVAHVGLVAIWILLFGIASYWVENDYVIWTPLALYALHAVTMVVLIAKGLLQRARGQGRDQCY
jgi:hypothetical protein